MLANFVSSPLNIDGGNNNNDSSGSTGGVDPGTNSQLGAGNNANAGEHSKDGDTKRSQQPPYMMPGVLHYLQYEWSRYELERSQWEMERAELKARISFLIGERKAQENLKHDLVRRIKMLEYALKQERNKFQHLLVSYEQLQSGQTTTGDKEDVAEQNSFQSNIPKSTVPLDIDAIVPPTPSPPAINKLDLNSSKQQSTGGEITNQEWAKARETLRQYLQEIGYTKKILDVRSFRVKHLLGLLPDSKQQEIEERDNRIENTEKALLDTEQAILETATAIKQLRCGTIPDEKPRHKSKSNPNEEQNYVDDEDNSDSSSGGDVADAFNLDADTAEAIKEFSFLRRDKDEDSQKRNKPQQDTDCGNDFYEQKSRLAMQLDRQYAMNIKAAKEKLRNDKRQQSVINVTQPKGGVIDDYSEKFSASSAKPTRHISIDAVYGIPPNTISQQSQPATDFTFEEEKFERIKGIDDEQHVRWNIRYTLRSHYDSIRAMQFHPVEPVLITASEDGTAKLWNLNSSSVGGSSKSGSGSGSDGSGKASQFPQPATGIIDIEPLYTFRGHRGPILAIDMSPLGENCYTAGLDGVICCWNVPPTVGLDIYQSFDASALRERLLGHEDAIWGLCYHSPSNRIISASADGTIRIWIVGLADGAMPSPLLKTITELDRPRSIDLASTECQHLAVACSGMQCHIRDFETGQIVLKFQLNENGDDVPPGEVNKILSHPTLPITITAGEDRKIRFFDNNTGKLINSTMAHMEGVSTLAIDSNGHYLLSGSHDGSIRLWDAEKRICLQEIAAHRKKLSSGVMALAFHPSRPLIGSAGADSLAKVYGTHWNSPHSSFAPSASSPSSSSGSSGASSLVNSPLKPQQQQMAYSHLRK